MVEPLEVPVNLVTGHDSVLGVMVGLGTYLVYGS